MAAQKNILRGISKATPAVVQVVDSTPEESLATARFFAGNAAEADSAEHVVMWLETALIWARGAVE